MPHPIFTFYLGVHRPGWLAASPVPLFISHAVLRDRKSFPRATTSWALDSGAFTEVTKYGCHRMSSKDYAARVHIYYQEIGRMDFAAPQDFMCEPETLERTGLSVKEHQRLTIKNFLELREAAPLIPWMPVLQGWSIFDYITHLEAYERAGVDLRKEPRVGVGSICERQTTMQAALILNLLDSEGLQLHGFGLKARGLELAAPHLRSADSLAWSTHERWDHWEKKRWNPNLSKTGRQNNFGAALEWLQNTIEPILPICEPLLETING